MVKAHKVDTDHSQVLDAPFYDGLKARGFKRKGKQMVHEGAGMRVNRRGFEDGYTIRWFMYPASREPDFTAFANTVEETAFWVAHIASGVID